jgi:predicted transposase/invertase (TIGR01784 family)
VLPNYNYQGKSYTIELEIIDINKIYNFKSEGFDKEDIEISNFLKYIDSKETSDDFTDKINHLVENAKINEKFRSKYLAVNIRETDIYEEGRNDGFAQGAEQKAIETAKNLLLKLIPMDVVAECTGLPLETIKKLVATQK